MLGPEWPLKTNFPDWPAVNHDGFAMQSRAGLLAPPRVQMYTMSVIRTLWTIYSHAVLKHKLISNCLKCLTYIYFYGSGYSSGTGRLASETNRPVPDE